MSGDGSASRGYRPALDGLRAVAVVAVLLYHADVPGFPGGFLGVDIFFVLSGYLITGLLVAEWTAKGSLNLGRFWLRRARRLLPAMLLIVLAIAAYAAWAAPEDQSRSIRDDLVATLAYLANWHFIAVDRSYFAQFESPSPLLHVWSLAIEEQFYLVFPLLLGLLLAATRARRVPLTLALLAGAAASSVLMAVLVVPDADPSRVYYGTDTRAQGLLLGAALAVSLPFAGAMVRRIVAPLGALALVALVVALTQVHADTPGLFRGGFLLVALASAVVVAAASGDTGVVRWLLARRPAVAIGVISYGLYLWHWPVFVFLDPTRTGLDGPALLLLRLFVTAVAATLSFHFVEQPIRQGALGRMALRTRLAVSTAGIAAAMAAVLAVGVGVPATVASAVGATDVGFAPTAAGARSAFLVGDSVPFGLRESFRQDWAPGLQVGGSTALGCGLVPEPLVVDGEQRRQAAGCRGWAQQWPAELAAAAPTYPMIFLGIGEQFDHDVDGRTLKFGTPVYATHLRHVLEGYVQAAGGTPGHPVLLVNVPCHRVPVDPSERDGSIINNDARTRWLNGVVDDVAAASAGRARVLDLHGFLCSDGYSDVRGGVTLRTDGLHFTADGAQLVWRWIADQLDVIGTSPAPGAPVGDVRAFVLGDSAAHGLHSSYVEGQVPGLSVTGSTELGCGLYPDLLVADHKRIPAEPQCLGWRPRWRDEVANLRPDVALLMVGSWEQYDRKVDGHLLEVGTPAFAAYLRRRLEADLDLLAASSGAVAIATVPCHRTPDFGLGPEPGVVNDDERVAAVNAVVRAVTADRPEVAIVDLDAELCGAGYSENRDGVRLRKDGLHFTDDGARLVWRWLGPQLLGLGPGASSG